MKDINAPPPPIPLQAKRGRGRPVFVPTKEQALKVQIMAGCGAPHEMIADQIVNPATQAPVDEKTLRKVFRAELDGGKAVANGLVAQSLFKKATGNGPQSVTAAIFWLKAQAGWKDRMHVQLEGNMGIVAGKLPKDLTDEELALALAEHGITLEP